MTQASNVTLPSLSGDPPLPTVVFLIFASSYATPLIAASIAFMFLSNDSPAIKLASGTFHVLITYGEEILLFPVLIFFTSKSPIIFGETNTLGNNNELLSIKSRLFIQN